MPTIITPAQHCAIVSRSAAAQGGRALTFAKFGETQAAACKRLASGIKRAGHAADTRGYPFFDAGSMSTAEYVQAFEALNELETTRVAGTWGTLNTAPATLYAGGLLDYAPECEDLAGAPADEEFVATVPAAGRAPAMQAAPKLGIPHPENQNAAPAASIDDRPCAGPGLTSYRARSRYGWIMIGATDDAHAMREALRSSDAAHGLQVWAGGRYVPVATGPAPCPGNATDAPSGQVPAGDAMAVDVADWLAKTWPHLADDPRPRAGLILAAQSERQRAARIHGRYAEIATACAQDLQARADALPVPPAATRQHAPFDGFGGAWQEIRNGRAAPDEYQAHVIEALQTALDAGLFYNTETYPRTAAVMAARWGYPDLRASTDLGCDGVPRDFGSHCYMANDAIRAREAREAQWEAREALRLAPGVRLGALVFTDGKLTRSAEVQAVSEDGGLVTLKGNRGAVGVTCQCSPVAVREAIERAHEKGKRRDTYAEFCAGRPAAAEVAASVVVPEPAAAGTPYPGNQSGAELGEIQAGPAATSAAPDPAGHLAMAARVDATAERCAEINPRRAAVAAEIASEARAAHTASLAKPVASVADTVAQCYGPDIDAASLADLQAANNTAATLAGAIDAAASGADAVRLLRAEAARMRLAADGQPVRVAARFLVASAMLSDLSQCRADDMANVPSIAPPADHVEARGMRIARDAMAGQMRTGAMTLPGLVLVMLRDKVVALSAALASVPADWCATNAELCAGLAPIKPAPTLRPGAWRGAPVAAGGAGAIGRARPTCHPWRAAGCGQMDRPPPNR